MKTTLHTDWTVGDICKGFIYDKNEDKGLFGLDGQLIILRNGKWYNALGVPVK